jgi:UDP-glucose 4-epimerase
MRILVTGGAGYIGSHTVRQLLAGGYDVLVYDSLEYGHKRAVPADRLVVGDLRDVDHLDHLLVVNRVEAVVHFAAYTSVGESVTDPARYYTTNLVYPLQLLDRCRRNGVQKFVFSSTAATYGVPEGMPITESARQLPVNPYGATKLAFERALADYAGAYPSGSAP